MSGAWTGTLKNPTKCLLRWEPACTSMCRHIYDWNVVYCDVKQPIHLTSPHMLLNIVLSIRRLQCWCPLKMKMLPTHLNNRAPIWEIIFRFLFSLINPPPPKKKKKQNKTKTKNCYNKSVNCRNKGPIFNMHTLKCYMFFNLAIKQRDTCIRNIYLKCYIFREILGVSFIIY